MFSNRLPSTSALRAFESAARQGSCAAAAQELCLTQSAVSKQLQGLEARLGWALFVRHSHGLTLTDAGQRYLAMVRTVLHQLSVAGTTGATMPSAITLRVPQSVAQKWLLPRYPAFVAGWPHVQVHFTGTAPGGADADAEIRFGDGVWPGVRAQYLFGNEVVLVAAPRLAERLTRVEAVFAQRRLLHYAVPQHWQQLERECRQPAQPRDAAVRLGYYSLVIDSALAGLGVALVPRALVEAELALGSLCVPLGLRICSPLGYHLVCAPLADPAPPALQGLLAWLERQCGEPATPQGRSVDPDVAHLDHATQ